MIDRLVHHAEVLTLAGDSYRTRARRELLKTPAHQHGGPLETRTRGGSTFADEKGVRIQPTLTV